MLGLRRLHEQHILHSDIKPENIFIDQHGNLKLGDLGICKLLVTTAGKITTKQGGGTIYYMAPECFKNMPASTAGDIWATGCIMYLLMKGEVLFRSDIDEENTDIKVLGRILTHVPSHLPKDYSRPLRL